MTSFSSILKLIRIHTASLTIFVCLLATILGGTSDVPTLILISMIALLYHASGFTMNSLYDYKYDIHDDNKKHFPTVTGEINIKTAFVWSYSISVIIILIMDVSGASTVSILLMMASIIAGIIYNKTSKWRRLGYLGPIWISIAFTTLPMSCYLFNDHKIDIPAIIFFAICFYTMLYQISISGYWKDLQHDRTSLLRSMGVTSKTDNGHVKYTWTLTAQLYAVALKVIAIALIITFAIYLSNPISIIIIIYLMLTISLIFVTIQITIQTPIAHKDITLICSLIEVFNYYAIVFAFYELIGYWIVFFIFMPAIWFMIFNRLTWGKGYVMSPNV